jgi:hypothetical protein
VAEFRADDLIGEIVFRKVVGLCGASVVELGELVSSHGDHVDRKGGGEDGEFSI